MPENLTPLLLLFLLLLLVFLLDFLEPLVRVRRWWRRRRCERSGEYPHLPVWLGESQRVASCRCGLRSYRRGPLPPRPRPRSTGSSMRARRNRRRS